MTVNLTYMLDPAVIITFTFASLKIGPLAYLVPYQRAQID